MRCRQGVGIRLRPVGFVFFSLTVLLGFVSTNAMAGQCDFPLSFPCFTAKPLIDGDATPLYKGQYKGNLYGHWDSGFTSSTAELYLPNPTLHDTDGQAKAASIGPLCPDGSQNNCDPIQKKIVVVALGFSNWTKELCGDQFAQLPGIPPHNYQADPNGEWPAPLQPVNLPCDPDAWSFSNYSHVNDNSAIRFVDCAIIGAVAKWWKDNNVATGIVDPPPHGLYTNCINILEGASLDPRQVQVVLFKDADSGRSEGAGDPGLTPLPGSGFTGCSKANPKREDHDPDACVLIYWVGEIARRITCNTTWKQTNCDPCGGFFPNTKIMFVHSRIYGGYANPDGTDTDQYLNPEPFAYESGFAMKWLIQSQIDEMQAAPVNAARLPAAGSLEYSSSPHPHAPWIDWGPYLWAGMNSDPNNNRLYPSPCHNCAIQDLTWRQDKLGKPEHCTQQSQECDFESLDNTHPGQCGRYKVAWMLAHFYCGRNLNDPTRNYRMWFWGPTQGNVQSCGQPEPQQPLNNGCGGFTQGPE